MTTARERTLARARNYQPAADGRPATRTWFKIVRNSGVTPSRVDLYDDIGGSGLLGGGIAAADFIGQIADIDGPLDVHINSAGGDVFDGLAIFNALASRPGQVTTVVDGIAASIASVIAQAGTTRLIAPGAMMMIHDALSMCIGNAADMRETASLLDQVSDNLAGVYALRGGTPAQWRAAMQTESWYTAAQAVDAGLADQLAERPADPAAVAAHARRVSAVLPSWLAAADSDDDGQSAGTSCRTCAGTGRLKHGATGKPSIKCPSCRGSGTYSPDSDDDDDGEQDGDGGMPADHTRRVLGIESMPIVDGPIPVHHTATVDTPWDGPAAVAAMPAEYATLHYCHAWETPEATASPHKPGDDDADDVKGNYKFPHHTGVGSPANIPACRNGLARLSRASIPDTDRAGVKAHLQAHIDDHNKGAGSSAGDHQHHDLTAEQAHQIAASLREAFK